MGIGFAVQMVAVFTLLGFFRYLDYKKFKDKSDSELEQKKAELKAMKMNSDAIVSVLTVASCNNLDILNNLAGHSPSTVVSNSDTGLTSYEGTIKDSFRKIQYNYYIEEVPVEE